MHTYLPTYLKVQPGSLVWIPSEFLVWETASSHCTGLRMATVTPPDIENAARCANTFGESWAELPEQKVSHSVNQALLEIQERVGRG